MHQIKEKFGTLRLYAGSVPNWVWDILEMIEADTARVCEDCGKVNGEYLAKSVYARVRLRRGGWLRTLCDDCEVAYKANIGREDPDVDPEDSRPDLDE
jgi:hypothetical protein